jgi:hypothetical protein
LKGSDLACWLVEAGLAGFADGRLVATPLGRELGDGITTL